jgi:hypothetical protein
MAKLVSWIAGTALVVAAASQATAQPITILPSSLVRVRADNHFGVTDDSVINPPVFSPTPFVSSITDSGGGTTATSSATYEMSLTGSTAVFDIQTTQSYSLGSTSALTEGFIQFTISEPLVYELSGTFTGASANDREAYQQRTFLRQFVTPFATAFLEDETRVATLAVLYVNQANDTGDTPNSTFNQSGARLGVLPAGTYEFAYELESRDRDGDLGTAAAATGRTRLVLRKPAPPTGLRAVVVGGTVTLSWTASLDAGSYILEAGSTAGASDIFSGPIGNGTTLTAPVPTGTYFVRLFTANSVALGLASDEITFSAGTPTCTTPPPTPAGHAVDIGGVTAALRWGSSPGATSYMLEAGTASGAVNLANLDVGGRTTLTADVPAMTYFTRVRAVNACGTSGPSNEASFTTCVAPAAPVLTFTRPAGSVRLDWTTSLGATAYVLQVGTTAGASNIFVGSFGTSTSLTFPNTVLPAGVYYMRIVAAGPCASSAPSADVAVTLP